MGIAMNRNISADMSSAFRSNMYLYYVEGSIICLTNSVLLFSILGNNKNRQRREFILIVSQAIADSLYAISFMFVAELRLRLADEGRESGNSTVWKCALEPALPIHDFSTPLLGLLPLATSMNFLLCTIAPFFYLTAGKIYTSILVLTPYIISFLLLLVNYLLLWGDQSPTPAQCVATKGAAHPIIYGIMRLLRLIATLASALIYGFILIYLRKIRTKGTPSEIQKGNHRNSTITLGFVTINSIILLFIPDILMFLNPYNIVQDFSTLLYSMTLSKTMINFFIYMWRYRELRMIVIMTTFGRFELFKSVVSQSQRSAGRLTMAGTNNRIHPVTNSVLDTTVRDPQSRRGSKATQNTFRDVDSSLGLTKQLPPLRVPPSLRVIQEQVET